MSYGKYSVEGYKKWPDGYEFKYNCYGQEVEEYKGGDDYNTKTMFGNYDEEGYDMYGYSAFDADNDFVGHGEGEDRIGMSEYDYMQEYIAECRKMNSND